MLNETKSTEATEANSKPDKVGNPPKIAIYAQAAKHAPKAIRRLAIEMEKGDNSNARVAAAKILLAKCIPDLTSAEITGKNGQPLYQFGFLKDFISAGGWNVPAPDRSSEGSDAVQSADMAQEGPQNNDSSGKDQPGSP